MARYQRPLFSYLLRYTGDRDTAQDMFQETFLRVIDGLERYDDKDRFGSWLFRIAHRIAIDGWRREERRPETTEENALRGAVDPRERPDVSHERRETLERIEGALEKLTDGQRAVFLLRHHGGLKFREIAEITGEPLNTVLSHERYAVQKLRRVLSSFEEG